MDTAGFLGASGVRGLQGCGLLVRWRLLVVEAVSVEWGLLIVLRVIRHLVSNGSMIGIASTNSV